MTSKLGTFGLDVDNMVIEDEDVHFPLKPLQTSEEEEEEEEKEEEMEKQKQDVEDDFMNETYPEENTNEAIANFLPNQLSLNGKRLHLMSRVLFDDYTADHVAVPSFSKRRRMHEEATSDMDQSEEDVSPLMETTEDEIYKMTDITIPEKRITVAPYLYIPEESLQPEIAMFELGAIPKYNHEKSILIQKDTSCNNALLFNARAFRVGFGPNGLIAIPGFDGSQISIQKITIPLNENETRSYNICSYIESDLEISFENCKFSNDRTDTQLPRPYLDENRISIMISEYIKSVEKVLADQRLNDKMFFSLKHSESVWKLVNALWGELSPKEAHLNKNEVRRRRLSEWLKEQVQYTVKKELEKIDADKEISDDKKAIKKIFTMLTGNQIKEASKLANESKNSHLAMIISQSNTNHADLQRQIQIWRENRSMKIDEDIFQIYQLLSGDIFIKDLRNLDWKRRFGLHLWYKIPFSRPLDDAFNSFNEHGDIKAYPPYVEMKYYTSFSISDTRSIDLKSILPSDPVDITYYDTNYHLLSIYTKRAISLDCIFPTWTHTTDILDYHLLWHLYQILSAKLSCQLSRPNDLHMNYAFELELAGMCKWAVYAAMHLGSQRHAQILDNFQNNFLVNSAVRNILFRYIESCNEEDNQFLIIRLQIPKVWIYAARALKNYYDGDYYHQVLNLIESEQYYEAYNILVHKLIPEAILNGDHSSLSSIIKTIPNNYKVGKKEGRIYLEYMQTFEGKKAGSMVTFYSDYLEAFIENKEDLETALKLAKDMSELESKALTEEEKITIFTRAQIATDIARTLVALTSNDKGYLSLISSQIKDLPIPISHRIDQLSQLAYKYLE
jgi:hypothetical protein